MAKIAPPPGVTCRLPCTATPSSQVPFRLSRSVITNWPPAMGHWAWRRDIMWSGCAASLTQPTDVDGLRPERNHRQRRLTSDTNEDESRLGAGWGCGFSVAGLSGRLVRRVKVAGSHGGVSGRWGGTSRPF